MYNAETRERERGVNSQKGYNHARFNNSYEYTQMIRAAATYFYRMNDLRKKIRRDTDYCMGRQLNDTVVYNGMTMTVHDYMEMKGMTPISNDIITDKVEGTVTEIGIFYTKILSIDNKRITIPNADLKSFNTISDIIRYIEARVN